MKVLPMLLALAVPGLCWAEDPQTFEGAGVVFEVQVEKNLVDIDHRLYRLPNSTVRNGMPSLFQVKPGSVVSYSGTVSQPWSTITDIYIHKQMSEQEPGRDDRERTAPPGRGGAAPMRTRQKGFTLLEMVVVVAVIGILLGIAIPSYQNYVIRSNRTEGQALLSDAAARQERYYSQNPGVGYTKDVAKLGMSSANSPNNLYNLTIATPTSTTYTLTATPINSQTRDKTCGKLTLNQLGERGAAGKTGNNSTVNDCWR